MSFPVSGFCCLYPSTNEEQRIAMAVAHFLFTHVLFVFSYIDACFSASVGVKDLICNA